MKPLLFCFWVFFCFSDYGHLYVIDYSFASWRVVWADSYGLVLLLGHLGFIFDYSFQYKCLICLRIALWFTLFVLWASFTTVLIYFVVNNLLFLVVILQFYNCFYIFVVLCPVLSWVIVNSLQSLFHLVLQFWCHSGNTICSRRHLVPLGGRSTGVTAFSVSELSLIVFHSFLFIVMFFCNFWLMCFFLQEPVWSRGG